MQVAIYCRLSEEDRNKREEKDSESIINQKQMLKDYAEKKGWGIYKIYSDDDYTGADRNRPAFNQMIDDAKKGLFQIILCKTQSRFTREMELVERYIHYLFPLWGIRFVSIVDGIDTEIKGNKKARQINGLVNEWYLEDMSESIKSVFDIKRKNGLHIGSFALYGYIKDETERGKLKIDPEAAEIVRLIFNLYISGYGKSKIAKTLNEKGVPNPSSYKRQKGLKFKTNNEKSGTLWRYSTISSILNNQMYIGNMVQGKYGSVSYKSKVNKPRPRDRWYIVKNTHPPIIDKIVWEKAQAILSEKTRPQKAGEIGVFSKKVFCAHCGYTLKSSKSKGKTYLKCPTHYISKNECIGSFISVDSLEKTVLSELNKIFDHHLDKKRLLSLKIKPLSHTKTTEEKIKKNEDKIRQIYEDKLNGIISKDLFLQMLIKIENEQKNLRRVCKTTQKGEKELNLDSYIHPTHLTRELVDMLVEKIVVEKRVKGTKIVPVTIFWNF